MSNLGQIACCYCGKDDFKSVKGLKHHLALNQRCRERHEAAISANLSARRVALLNLTRQTNVPTRRSQRLNPDHGDSHQPSQPQSNERTLTVDQPVGEEPGEGETTNNCSMTDNDLHHDQPTHDEDFGQLPDDDATNEASDSDPEDDDADHGVECSGPSHRARDEFVDFCNKNKFFAPFTRGEVAGIKLMDVLWKKRAPINAYPSMMEWHLRESGQMKDSQQLKDMDSELYVGRNTLLKRLAKRYNLVDKGPKEMVVRLPSSKEVVKIPVFDAEDKVAELLTDPRLEVDDFDFFDGDPLAPPPENLDYVGNVNTGSGFFDTYHALIEEANEQLVGTQFYIDAAATGLFSDLPVTAVKFSLTCFTREARLKPHTWATLGYLPEIKVAEGRGKKLFKESQHLEAVDMDIFDGEGDHIDIDPDDDEDDDGLTEVKAQDFHFMLQVILAPYVKLQRRGMLWNLMHDNTLTPNWKMVFYIPHCRVDGEEADALCGKYKVRTGNVKQLCRQCYVPTLEAGDHRANYKNKTQTKIEKLVKAGNLGKLKAISQHYLKNAWYVCRFNQGNDRGIHGACPTEMLHAMQLGIFKYTRDIFFEFLGDTAQVAYEINGLARIYGRLLSHQSDRSLPATNFSRGIKEGKLMAKDYRGVLLIMAVVLRSTLGRKLLSSKKKFKQDHRKDDWLLLVELLLEWEAFLCQPTMKKRHVARLGQKHRYIMYIMSKVAKRTKGMGLNIMKFHAIVHLMDDILVHGVPLEVDTAANESHHKISKLAALLTQRNESNFNMQVAIRMFEFHIIDLALHELETGRRVSDYFDVFTDQSDGEMSVDTEASDQWTGNPDQTPDLANETQAAVLTDDARIRVFIDEETGEDAFEILSQSKHKDSTALSNDLLHFLVTLQVEIANHLPGGELEILTRHRRNGTIFRGHPNFRGQGPWKDWAVVDWGSDFGRLPCHIHCFVRIDGLPSRLKVEYGGIWLKDGVFGVVEATTMTNDPKELAKSDLLVPLVKEVEHISDGEVDGRKFYLADTEAFVSACAVIPDIGGPPNGYFMVKPRSAWHKEFIAWIDRPHHEDDDQEEEE